MNMLHGMKYGKEKGFGEGAKFCLIMYLRRYCAEGAKKNLRKKFWSPLFDPQKNFGPRLWPTEKKLVPPFDHPKKFWSPPPQTDALPPGKK